MIYCAISGFGADGPLGGLPGYDAVLQAMCGLMSINGTQESGATRVGIPIVDYVTGYNALTGVLLALAARERTGTGQRVEVTLFDTALSLLIPHAANWICSGSVPGRLGSAHPNIAPYDKFAAADGEIFLGILNEGQFRRFCQTVGRSDLLDDPRFRTNADRLRHVAALRTELERTLAAFKSDDLCGELMRAGVPAGAVNTVPQAFAQPHTAHRDMLVESEGHRAPGIPSDSRKRRVAQGGGRRVSASMPAKFWRKRASVRPRSTRSSKLVSSRRNENNPRNDRRGNDHVEILEMDRGVAGPAMELRERCADLSDQAGKDHRPLSGRSGHRRGGQILRRPIVQNDGPALLYREQARRRRQHRRRGRRRARKPTDTRC